MNGRAAPRVARAAATTSLALLLGGCAAAPSDTDDSRALTGELSVYAAASLGAAFDEIAEAFERANPHVDVLPIVYDGSSRLATQLVEGAAADVFATADERTMARVTDAGLAADPAVFATNTLVITVPAGNPADIRSLDDLARSDVTTVVCAPEVPCGAASQALLAEGGVELTPASLEQNVTAVLTKVEADEADAGLVYATDVVDRDAVDVVVPEEAAEVVNRYPIVAMDAASRRVVADAFVGFVLSAEGQTVLTAHGFGAP